ncbi:MAG: methyltransferase domain-containing protein [Candidatus Hodarchaeota archaeon]
MKEKLKNFSEFHSQLDLPFSETDYKLLGDIFNTLELKFGLKRASNQKLIDLGAGNGSIVIFTAINYCIKAYGIEIDHNLVKETKIRIKLLKQEGNYEKGLNKKIKVKQGDFFTHNLEEYNYIYIYSFPSMHKYLKHVFRTAKKGAIIISHKYKLENFSSILKNEYILTHKMDKQQLFTFFYKKIS